MRLLNCSTLQFEDVTSANQQTYSILSHTWHKNEVLYGPLSDYKDPKYEEGMKKILGACKIALRDQFKHIWIDTCCIDKKSSAELSEAINSMYTWYSKAKRCYVYLKDFDSKDPDADLSKCLWFTRGWTLQELIAPSDMHFYDKKWRYFGSKLELYAALEAITGIERAILRAEGPLHLVSVAKRMSWASQRQTTREEDMAYCLIGIFGINMPLLYGEGGVRAFMRLQEELIKESNDLTVFAWQAKAEDSGPMPYRGALAWSPQEFKDAGSIVSVANPKTNPEFAITNKGVRIQTQLSFDNKGMIFMPLNCHRGERVNHTIGIYLVSIGGGVFTREVPDRLGLQDTRNTSNSELIYITKDVRDARYI
ncbi:unnamed protein product [Periconia digitata]|uniref:Heterokaryon incompatibility domain-containing protein n=1 Tax=Periconia digitata TaxID=1303443 RepID=A0A9W4UPA1_9PLEO|nr:unnamed protein product [Periconia digitata]